MRLMNHVSFETTGVGCQALSSILTKRQDHTYHNDFGGPSDLGYEETRALKSSDAETAWSKLSRERGLSCGLMNLAIGYPPQPTFPLPAWCVCGGKPSPRSLERLCYPYEITHLLKQPYVVDMMERPSILSPVHPALNLDNFHWIKDEIESLRLESCLTICKEGPFDTDVLFYQTHDFEWTDRFFHGRTEHEEHLYYSFQFIDDLLTTLYHHLKPSEMILVSYQGTIAEKRLFGDPPAARMQGVALAQGVDLDGVKISNDLFSIISS